MAEMGISIEEHLEKLFEEISFNLDAETRAKYDRLYEEIPDFMVEITLRLDKFVLNTVEDEDIQFFIDNQLTCDVKNFYYMMGLLQCSSWYILIKIMRLATGHANMSENELILLNFEWLVKNINKDILRKISETPNLTEEQKQRLNTD